MVAPVVSTSSISKTCLPCNIAGVLQTKCHKHFPTVHKAPYAFEFLYTYTFPLHPKVPGWKSRFLLLWQAIHFDYNRASAPFTVKWNRKNIIYAFKETGRQ